MSAGKARPSCPPWLTVTTVRPVGYLASPARIRVIVAAASGRLRSPILVPRFDQSITEAAGRTYGSTSACRLGQT